MSAAECPFYSLMSEFGLAPEVKQIITTHLATMDHVDALALLYRSASGLSRDDIAPQNKKAGGAHQLSARGSQKRGSRHRCFRRWRRGNISLPPQSDELRSAADALLDVYDARPVTLIRAIYDRPASPVISFAEAFRVRKGDS